MIPQDVLQQIRAASIGIVTTDILKLIDEFLAWTLSNCARDTYNTRRSRLKKLGNFLRTAGITDIAELNNAVLAIYFDNALGDLEISSRNADKKTIKAFISWLEEYKEMPTKVQVAAIKMTRERKRRIKYLDFKHIEKVLESRELEYVDRLMIAVASKMGLRAGEISSMKYSDINGDVLHVRGKGDDDRNVTIPSSVQRMLDVYRQIAPYSVEDDAYMFQSFWRGEWRQMSEKTIWKRVKAVFMRVCEIDAWPHALRHSYAINLLLQGCDIVTVQKSLGHSDIKITQVYLDIADNIVSQQIHKYIK